MNYRLYSKDEAEKIRQTLDLYEWSRGKTANPEMGEIKRNQELQHPELSTICRDIQQRLIQSCAQDIMASLVLPPKFNRYEVGDEYRAHYDAPYMQTPSGQVRTDYSMTLFLSEFEGGELCVGGEKIKGEMGECVVYPSNQLHSVAPVTKGVRICAISWMQSQIADPHKRDLLLRLRDAIGSMERFSDVQTEVAGVHGELMRMWSA